MVRPSRGAPRAWYLIVPMRRVLLIVCALVGLAACGDEANCPERTSCHWDSCRGRMFTACGVCPGGAIADRRCHGGTPLAVTRDAEAPSCHNTPCLHPHVCRADDCVGSIVYTGCCECPAATVDVLDCGPHDAAVR